MGFEVAEERNELLAYRVGKGGEDTLYARVILHRQRRGDRHTVHTVKRKNLKVELNARAAAWVGARNRKHALHLSRHARSLTCLAILCALLLPGFALAGKPIVILLSMDGVRPDYFDRAKLYAMERMIRDGAKAEKLIPVFPTSTFPNHVTLATGAPVAVHGIVGNSFRDEKMGRFHYSNKAEWIEAEPIWIAAERQGVSSATYFWVGSETNWNGVRPSYRKAPFNGRISEREKVRQIGDWLDYSEELRPQLIMSWWHGADKTGHEYGPEHSQIAEQMIEQDIEVMRLLKLIDDKKLWDDLTLFIVSDHGMAAANDFIDVIGPLEEKGITANLIPSGGMGFINLRKKDELGAAAAILDALPHIKVMPNTRPDRMGDIVVVTDPPFTLSQAPFMDRLMSKLTFGVRGTHGYAVDVPEMAGIFLAVGRGVPKTKNLGEVRALDVAATVAAFLGIDPPKHSEGKPILLPAPGK